MGLIAERKNLFYFDYEKHKAHLKACDISMAGIDPTFYRNIRRDVQKWNALPFDRAVALVDFYSHGPVMLVHYTNAFSWFCLDFIGLKPLLRDQVVFSVFPKLYCELRGISYRFAEAAEMAANAIRYSR